MKEPRTLWDEIIEFTLAVLIICLIGWASVAKILTGRKSELVEFVRGCR